MDPNPDNRIRAADAINHKWLQEIKSESPEDRSSKLIISYKSHMSQKSAFIGEIEEVKQEEELITSKNDVSFVFGQKGLFYRSQTSRVQLFNSSIFQSPIKATNSRFFGGIS